MALTALLLPLATVVGVLLRTASHWRLPLAVGAGWLDGEPQVLRAVRGRVAVNSTSCSDVPPDASHTCQQQRDWGKCGETWMKGHCCQTCFGCQGCGAGPAPSAAGGGSVGELLRLGCGNCHGCGLEGQDAKRQSMEAQFAGACRQEGCSTEELAVVLAMAMQESDSMDETDTSKGSSGPSSNWSPFNMNMDQLSRLGCDASCAASLGQRDGQYDIGKAVHYLVMGLRGGTAVGGTCDFLNFHRDGYSGWQACLGRDCSCDCGSAGCKAYKDATADAANTLLRTPSYFSSGVRVCESVPHIR